MSAGEAIVSLEHVTKEFVPSKPPALKEIHATLPKGKIVGLVGPDGAGKTTLIRLIAALLLPTKGEVSVAGYDTVKDAEAIHCLTGYMPQKFGLYEDLSVMRNLELYADLRGVVGEERAKKFEKLLKFTALSPFISRLAGALSGGMKQKLGLACALISKPTLLLLDEPSVGVDPLSRRELWEMVQELIAEGISVVWSTAYLDEAERCDSVLLLNEGEVLFQGTSQELTERVRDRVFKITKISSNRRELLIEVLRQENVIDGVIQGQDIRLVSKEKNKPPLDLSSLKQGAESEILPIQPRFEDAFVDILGGGPSGASRLAQIMPVIGKDREAVVTAEGLTKRFGSFTAADRISFKIQRKEIFGLLGPNGAGKSTTFKMLCGLLRPTSGKALVKNYDLQLAPGEGRAHIGYMAQKFSLYGNLSVKQNLEFFSGAYNLRGKQKKEIIHQMIEIFSFQDYLDTSAELLPLGFKQRLALSCATMHHPEVLFLDEPTSGVDPLTRREFWNHINGLVGKGVTIMVTTHFMDEAEWCDRIALIYKGQVIHMETPDALKAIAQSEKNPTPTLEDAFIQLIEEYDKKKGE